MENIVLVGPIGNGKSSTGNSIVGKHVFVAKTHAGGVTIECKSEIVETPAGGPKLRVIDTPSLFDMTFSADFISKQIVRCLQLAEGGLHAVLLVLSVRNQVTEEEDVVLGTLEVLFGSKIVDYLIVVFTGGDVLDEDNETIESYLDGCPYFLKRLLRSCKQRMVVFDNKTKNEGKKTKQFQELLNTIDLVRKHTNYKPHTEDMYHKITEETDRNKKEHEVLEKKELTEEEVEELRKALQLKNEQNLKAITEKMEKYIEMAQENFFSRQRVANFTLDVTHNVLLQMRSEMEAEKAREDWYHAEEERHLKEMQNEIDQMQSNECSEMEKKS